MATSGNQVKCKPRDTANTETSTDSINTGSSSMLSMLRRKIVVNRYFHYIATILFHSAIPSIGN